MVCLNYIVTLAIFPGLVVSVPSAYGITDGWFPIILIFIFNFGDASSRYAVVNHPPLLPLMTHTTPVCLFVCLQIDVQLPCHLPQVRASGLHCMPAARCLSPRLCPLCQRFVSLPWSLPALAFSTPRTALCSGVIVQDIACMVLTLALGWTNGYVSVNSWQHGRHALSKSTKEVGGYIQTLAMALGITLGVVLALATNKIANPASV